MMADADALVPAKKLLAMDHPDGTRHVTVDGNLHSVDDEPGCVFPDGSRFWYRDGHLHRDGAPAVIYSNGVEEWWQNGRRHRDDGPAVIYPDHHAILPEFRGVKQFWQNGKHTHDDAPPHVAAYRRELEELRKRHFGG